MEFLSCPIFCCGRRETVHNLKFLQKKLFIVTKPSNTPSSFIIVASFFCFLHNCSSQEQLLSIFPLWIFKRNFSITHPTHARPAVWEKHKYLHTIGLSHWMFLRKLVIDFLFCLCDLHLFPSFIHGPCVMYSL